MASLNMGSNYYPLNQETIDRVVENGRIGNYAYGYINGEGMFVVRYVGRSDTDLHVRISHGISEYRERPALRYDLFKFSYACTAQEAYEKECRNYHDFGGERGLLANTEHPDRPKGTFHHCPICGAPHSHNYADLFHA